MMILIFEKNVIQKNLKDINLRIGLCYPNIYRTAMSSLGYEILYNMINDRKDSYCERIIYPNTRSIETNSPLKDFDIISFTMQYEEDYFNIVKMLHDSEIPLRSKDRGDNDSLIIAGGPCATANPMPMADFIDLFVIGEGEKVIDPILDTYLQNPSKELTKYLDIQGVYIPKLNNSAKIAIVEDMNEAYHVTYPIISETNEEKFELAFKDSIMLNVSRGCTRGCRFCMSSYLYRPMRETGLKKLIEIAEISREKTGLNKIVLIGAAVSDYSHITELIEELKKRDFQIATPSLRIESIDENHLRLLKKSGLKTLTLAPESISKLRNKINKHIPDEKIFEVVKTAFELNFNIKLYFLIGLPTETVDDIKELSEFMKKIAKYNINNNTVKFSVNPVIPKPHTPLQWKQYNLKDIKKKMRLLKKEMRGYNIKFESPKKGMIQYILSCGNRSISHIIEKSLTKNITMKEWKEYLPNYNIHEPLPWKNIDIGIKNKFLVNEYERIESGKKTPWCEKEVCYNCGACND